MLSAFIIIKSPVIVPITVSLSKGVFDGVEPATAPNAPANEIFKSAS